MHHFHFLKLLTVLMIFLVFMTVPAFSENDVETAKTTAVQMERNSFYNMAQNIQRTGFATTVIGVGASLVSGQGDWLILSGIGAGAVLSGCAVAFKARRQENN